MTKLDELLDTQDLLAEIAAGNIRVQYHPEFPQLAIYNYSDQCAYNRHWTPTTRICRGLIVNYDDEEVLARPFPKFFNFDEKEAPRILDDQVVYAYGNKFDGSLGIMYKRPDGKYALATRGSFASDQAKLGTKMLQELDDFGIHADNVDAGYTQLFEICGPDNRIVLNYEKNFLAFLGGFSIEHGYALVESPRGGAKTMRSLLMDLSRTNAEGWVVWKTAYEAVKIKQADYIELHRIVSNLSQKEVWRQLRAGTYDKFVQALPDEWHDWSRNIADGLREEFVKTYNQAEVQFRVVRRLQSVGGEPHSRKAQALWLIENVKPEIRGLVFSLLDGRSIHDSIWRLLEPKG